jgi:hypothetical protein
VLNFLNISLNRSSIQQNGYLILSFRIELYRKENAATSLSGGC